MGINQFLLFLVKTNIVNVNKFATGEWANIAIRWRNLRYNDTASYINLRSDDEFVGGLEVSEDPNIFIKH